MRWVAITAAVVLAAGLLVWQRAGGAPRPLPALTQPHFAYDGDIGDPFILVVPGTGYVAYGTGDWPARIPTAITPDLVHWQQGPDAFPVLPGWATPDPDNALSWAPAALRVGNHYVLYLSLQQESTQRECIAAATSASPTGPFTDALGHPLVCQLDLGGSIDPSVIDGHLLWKSDGNCCGLPATLWEQPLRADGLAVTGTSHRLLTADQAWQGGVIENPAMVAASSGWWLFYSGNTFDTAAYATGVAWCPRIEGPCTDRGKVLAGPTSPGGLETFRDMAGHLHAVFATWTRPARDGHFYCCRALDLADLRP